MHRRINFGALKKSVTGAVSSAASGARELAFDAKEAVERAMVAKCLRPYVMKEQIGTTGLKGLWKIYSADSRNPNAQCASVSVWILEKKLLQDSSKTRARVWEPYLDQQKMGAAQLLRLKHPGILKVLEPLEETRTQFVMVTEPVLCSLLDWMSFFSAVPDVSESIRDVAFSELEIKHGLLQISSAIGFLHTDASACHLCISPESIIICADGHWALSNLGFSTQVDFTGSKTMTSFDYSNIDPPFEEIVRRPRLEFIAPELATSQGDDMSVVVTPAVDIFSLGLVMYSCLTRSTLFCGVEQDIGKYKTKIASIALLDLSTLPSALQPFVRMMLSPTPASRPSISGIPNCAYFQDDKLLRALQFLEGMVGRDPMQKVSFLKDLEQFWTKFDIRVVRHKVLPPLLQELQNPALQSLIIPFVFKAAGNQTKEEFADHTLPLLKTVLKSIKGEALLTVLNHYEMLMKVMSRSTVTEVLLPVFLNACDQQMPKIQEEALKKAQTLFECLDYQQIKAEVLPRLHSLSMKTVSAKVRINALVLMASLIPRLDKDEAQNTVQTCTQIAKVDKSPGTLMCILGVGDAISKFWGEEITAETVIPLLSPLLVSKKLSHQQFNTYLTVVRDMVNRIEEKMGKQIRELDPAAIGASKQSQNQEKVDWDTSNPKDALSEISSSSVGWMDGSSPAPTAKNEVFRTEVAQTTGGTGSDFRMPQPSTSTTLSSQTDPFMDLSLTRPPMQTPSMFDGLSGLSAVSSTAPSQQNPVQPKQPQMAWNAMDFGPGLSAVPSQPVANGTGELDLLSGMNLHGSSQPVHAPMQSAASQSPGLFDPTSPPPPPKPSTNASDPFADLLG